MNKIVECIPNFSEGRDAAKIAQFVAAIRSVPGAMVLDYTMDYDHHRSVITFAGEPDTVVEAAVRVARRAIELIDLNQHSGQHPRMGAIDVLPFVPVRSVTMDECVQLARRAGERIAREFHLPVYLYERAATRSDRVDLADVRRDFEKLRREVETNPDRKPDFGEARLHPTAGAVAVGARPLLVAYNINLLTDDLTTAKKIARAVRGRDGGLRYVKALGLELKQRGLVQVSMNLTRFEATPLFRVFELVKREADRYGVRIAGSEIVGLIPQAALNTCADFYLQIENFSDDLILENRLREELDKKKLTEKPAEPDAGWNRLPFSSSSPGEVAPTPGGGGVTAYVGALAVSLGTVICNLTLNQQKYFYENFSGEDEARRILAQFVQVEADLRQAMDEDEEMQVRLFGAEAIFDDDSEAGELAKWNALDQASRSSAAVRLRIAELNMQVLELLDELTELGRASEFPDIAIAAQLSLSAMRGAYYGLLEKLSEISDTDYIRQQRDEVEEMIARGQEIADSIEEQFLSRRFHN